MLQRLLTVFVLFSATLFVGCPGNHPQGLQWTLGETSPAQNATGVELDQEIRLKVLLGEGDVLTDADFENTVRGPGGVEVPGVWAIDPIQADVIVFTPDAPGFSPSTTYIVDIKIGGPDKDGAFAIDEILAFTTGANAVCLGSTLTNPPIGQTLNSLNGCIQIAFDAEVDSFSLLNGAILERENRSNPDGMLRMERIDLQEAHYDSAQKRASFCPVSPLVAGNQYRLSLADSIMGTQGQAVSFCSAPAQYSFRTYIDPNRQYTIQGRTTFGDFTLTSNNLIQNVNSGVVTALVTEMQGFYDFQLQASAATQEGKLVLRNIWQNPVVFTITSDSGQVVYRVVEPNAEVSVAMPF